MIITFKKSKYDKVRDELDAFIEINNDPEIDNECDESMNFLNNLNEEDEY